MYILAGYSLADLELQKKELPQATLERAGFLSDDVAKDIASRLQWALERRLPEVGQEREREREREREKKRKKKR